MRKFEENGLYGIKDNFNNILVPAKYDEIYVRIDGFFTTIKDGKFGFINSNFHEIAKPKYDSVGDFDKGFAKVVLDEKMGMIDTNGTEVIPCKYHWIDVFMFGYARAAINGKWGVINKNAQELIPCVYDSIDLSYGMATLTKDGKQIKVNLDKMKYNQFKEIEWKYGKYFQFIEGSKPEGKIPFGHLKNNVRVRKRFASIADFAIEYLKTGDVMDKLYSLITLKSLKVYGVKIEIIHHSSVGMVVHIGKDVLFIKPEALNEKLLFSA